MLVLGILLCVIIKFTELTSAEDFCTKEYRRGLILSNTSVFRSQHHNTLSSCLKSCIATASCEAFTYNRHNLTCFFGSNGSQFESTTDLKYITSPSYWKSEENENVILPCTHSTCQQGSECHVLKNGNTVCVKTECVDSPAVANSKILVRERKVGQQVTIVCNEGFILSGNPQRICLGNGQWTDVNTTCIECGINTHFTTYNRSRDHCLSGEKKLLQYHHAHQALNVSKGRCVTCPDDLVADNHKRYLQDDCSPDTDYKNNTYCYCRFTTAVPGMKIRIKAVTLDLEYNYDFLWIFDGNDTISPVLGKYSGHQLFTLVTSRSESFMVFVSDHTISSSGFRLSYSMVATSNASEPISRQPQDFSIYVYLWVDGYLNATSREFEMPNGTRIHLSNNLLRRIYLQHTRLCYSPHYNQYSSFDGTDYCYAICETP